MSSAEPDISPEELATYRRCTFARRVFEARASLRSIPFDEDDGCQGTQPYDGKPFDPERWELVEGDWDHEHCDVCWAKVTAGMWYWPNVGPAAGQVDLCEACHPRVMKLLTID